MTSRSRRAQSSTPQPSGQDDVLSEPGSPTGKGNDKPSGKSFLARHKRAASTVLIGAAAFGFAYYVLPQFVGLHATVRRLRTGNAWWFALGVPLEAISLASYAAVFHAVFGRDSPRVGWRASFQVTLAGGAATKIFAAAGSGGIALMVWALRASGLPASTIATEFVCFEIVTYTVYMLALVVGGLGLSIGLFAGKAPSGLTLLPALFGLAAIVAVGSTYWLADPIERFLLDRERRAHKRTATWWHRAAGVPKSLGGGLRDALKLVRGKDRSWLAVLPSWGFDIGALWAAFHAFGSPPPAAVLVMGYFVGTLGNTLPLPAGIGGVEGGMIGAFIGFGVNGSLTVLAVLAYRAISYWLPLIPEAVGYLRLRHTVGEWRKQPALRSGEALTLVSWRPFTALHSGRFDHDAVSRR